MRAAVCLPLGDTTTGAILPVALFLFFIPAPVLSDGLYEDEAESGGGLFELDLIEQDWPIKKHNSRNCRLMPYKVIRVTL